MSRLIKSSWVPQEFSSENKVISIRTVRPHPTNDGAAVRSFESEYERERILDQARQEANAIIQQAEALRASILQQQQQEREALEQERQVIYEQAREQGFEHGRNEGYEQGYGEVHASIELAKETINCSKQDYQKKLESAEATILNIALKVADKIIGATIEQSPDHFLPLVKKALKEAKDYPEVTVHIHPSYYEYLVHEKNELLNIFPRETELYIFPDSELSPTSCVIESKVGRIDASVDEQLAEVKRKLFEILESE